ncbi:MAG: ABC transporter substrate-binding protein [Nitrospirae bacterium]|nr:ABC transporter substrate-binding protein [Magnetococcales bacterium]
MSVALSGPAQALGKGMQLGVDTYFDKINKSGGVQGRLLRFVVLDDGYEPKQAAINMRRLIDDEGVVAVVGNVGTPTAVVTVPITNEKRSLLFGAFTGADLLRKTPPDRYVINFRSSYAEETEAMIKALRKQGVRPEEIAFFTQNDGYGDAGYQGAMKALKAGGFANPERLSHGRYTRNTLNVEAGLATILDASVTPKAIIMVGTYEPCAKFIKLAKQDFPGVQFLNVSFVGSLPLAKELGKDGDGVIITQVVPHFDSSLFGVQEYRNDLNDFNPGNSPDFISLEGYLVAKIFVEGIKKAVPDLNRETLVNAIESLTNLDIGIGISINYSKNEHQGSHRVWPTVIRNGRFESLEW